MRWLQRLFILTFWFELLCGMLAGQIITTPHETTHEGVVIQRDDVSMVAQANAKEQVVEADAAIAPLPDDPEQVPPAPLLMSWLDLLEPHKLLRRSIPQPRGPPSAFGLLTSLTPIVPRGPPALPHA